MTKGHTSPTGRDRSTEPEYGHSPQYSAGDGPSTVTQSGNLPGQTSELAVFKPEQAPLPPSPSDHHTTSTTTSKYSKNKALGRASNNNPFEPEDSLEVAYNNPLSVHDDAPPPPGKSFQDAAAPFQRQESAHSAYPTYGSSGGHGQGWEKDKKNDEQQRRASNIEDNIVIVDVLPEPPQDKNPEKYHGNTCQLWYPLMYALLAAIYSTMALVPPWKEIYEKRYHIIRPLMFCAFGFAALMLIFSLVHTILLLCSHRARLSNKSKHKNAIKLTFSILSMVLTFAMTPFVVVCFLIMVKNWKEFHDILDLKSVIVWWAGLVVSTPILVWLDFRCLFDTIRLCCRKRSGEDVNPEPVKA